jgi:hypothetical protein
MDAKSKYPLCRHIKTNGRRCQGPALHSDSLCYFHRNLFRRHEPAPAPPPLRPETVQYFVESGLSTELLFTPPPAPALVFPPLEDAESIQLSLSILLSALAARQIHTELARNLLYTLQLASINVRALSTDPLSDADRNTIVRRVVHDPQGHPLAPPDEANEDAASEPATTPTE